MRNLLLALVCLAVAPASLGAAAKPQGRCPLSMVADLAVEVGPGGAVLLPVKIDGQDRRMFLNLRSGFSRIFEDALEVTGAKAETLMHQAETGSRVNTREQAIRSGGEVRNRYVALDGLQIGNANYGRFEALIGDTPMPVVREGASPIVGAIGSNAFINLDIELNLSENKVRLFKATECKDPPVYWDAVVTSVPSSYDKAGTLAFTMLLDGQRIVTAFDTTSRESNLDSRATARYFGFAPDAPELERAPAVDGQAALFRAMTLSAEGLNVSNTRVRLQDRPASTCKLARVSDGIGYDNCFNVTPLVIGTDLLKRLRLIVASKQKKIYFSAPTPGA